MRPRFLVAGVVILAGAAAALGFAWPFGRRAAALQLPGVVEIQEVRLGPRVAGRVRQVLVREGDGVRAGQELVRLDVPELEAQREVLRARLSEAQAEYARSVNGSRPDEVRAAEAAVDAARARWDRLRLGPRDQEIAAAAAELEAARADEKLADEEHERSRRLVRQSVDSRAMYASALAALNRLRSRSRAAQARLDLLEAGSRAEDIDEARADLDRLKAQYRLVVEGPRPEDRLIAKARLDEAQRKLAEVEVHIRESVVRAAEPALVELVTVRPGDLVAANQPVVKALRRDDLWVKTYVPETELGKVRLGQAVQVTVDSHPGRRFEGRIAHIAGESEFTPRNVQTVDERRHQMFGVRVRVEDPQGVYKSGMAAQVHVPVE